MAIKAEILKRALDKIKSRPQNYEYFFRKIQDPDWLEPLWNEGYFKEPPGLISLEEVSYYPAWPESEYLAKVAHLKPRTALKIMLKMDETDNPYVHRDLVKAAMIMKASQAIDWIRKEIKWVKKEDNIDSFTAIRLVELVKHLLQEKQIEEAFQLIGSMLEVKVNEEEIDRKRSSDPFVYSDWNILILKLDNWDYRMALIDTQASLIDADPYRSFSMYSENLDKLIHAVMLGGLDGLNEDTSYMWRPAIEDHEKNREEMFYGDIMSPSLNGVRDASEKIVNQDGIERLEEVVNKLLSRKWAAFHRIALHLLRLHGDKSPQLLNKIMGNKSFFETEALYHEYYLLLRDYFPKLSEKAKSKIMSWIEAGSNTVREEYADFWRYERLLPINDHLVGEWSDRFRDYSNKFEKIEEPEFKYGHRVFVGPNSPITLDKLDSMSVEDIVYYLINWQPKKGFHEPEPEGLGRALKQAVINRPRDFSEKALQFANTGMDATYVRYLIFGFAESSRTGKLFCLKQILQLCLWALKQEDFEPTEDYHDMARDPSWSWTRREIANLIIEVVSYEEQESLKNLEKILQIVVILVDDPDPTEQYESEWLQQEDPLSLAINSVRGTAIQAAIVLGHFLSKTSGLQKDEADHLNRCKELLKSHLNYEIDRSVAVRAIYGRAFPWLVRIDRDWAARITQQIFPVEIENEKYWRSSWTAFITFNRARKQGYEILRAQYAKALSLAGSWADWKGYLTDPDEKLGEHLMELYWGGAISWNSEDRLMVDFFSDTSPQSVKKHALLFVGTNLFHDKRPLEADLRTRLQELWEKRTIKLSHNNITLMAPELSAFGFWFASDKFSDKWSLSHLEKLLDFRIDLEGRIHVLDQLAKLSTYKTVEAVRCLGKLLKLGLDSGDSNYNFDPIGIVLRNGVLSPDKNIRETSEELINWLGARGITRTRELLKFKNEKYQILFRRF